MLKRLISVLIFVLLLPGVGWATNYYVNGSGAAYTDPQGNVWGIGADGNNGTSFLTPKATLAAGIGLIDGNSRTLIVAPATYLSGATSIVVSSANRTGVVIRGADTNPANFPIIDGSAFTAENNGVLTVRGDTTLSYLNFININKTANYVNTCGAIHTNNAGSTITVHHCRFSDNFQDIFIRGTCSVTEHHNIHINPKSSAVCTSTSFTGAGSAILSYYNKYYGYVTDVVQSAFLTISGTASDTVPTVSIYNNIFSGGTGAGIYVENNFYGTVNSKNNTFTGIRSYAHNFNSTIHATANVNNNAYTIRGFPGTTIQPASNNNCTDSSPISDSNFLNGSVGTGYIIIRKDDSIDATTTNLNYSVSLASAMAAKGWKLTLAADYAGAAKNNTWGQILSIQNDYGGEIACHSRSHAASDNDTNNIPFTVTYTGAGTWNLTTTSGGSPPTDTNVLTLTESVSGDDYSINLVTGVVTTNAGTPPGASYDMTVLGNGTTINGLRDWLASKSYLTVSTISTAAFCYYPGYFLSRCLDTLNLSGAGVKNVLISASKTHYYEAFAPIALLVSQGITTPTTFTFPFFVYDTTAITAINSYGYTTALGKYIYTDWKIGQQLRKLQMYELGAFPMNLLSGYSDADIRKWITGMCEAARNRRLVVTLMAHGSNEFTLAQWSIVLDELSKQQNIQVVSPKQLYNIITGDANYITADSGITYTRSAWTPDDSFHLPYQPSTLINAGDKTLGLTSDFIAKTVPNVTGGVTIGAYEYTYWGSQIGNGLGLSGGNAPPWVRRRE